MYTSSCFRQLNLQVDSDTADLGLWDDNGGIGIEDDYELQLDISDDEKEMHDSFPQITAEHLASEEKQDIDLEANLEGEVSEETEPDTQDDALDCLEDLVLTFLVKLSDALPGACSPSKGKKHGRNKVVLQLANRRKENTDDQRNANADPHLSTAIPRTERKTIRVVDLMHEALIDDIPTTKRDIYYKDVQLFRSQATVDRLVDDLPATFRLSRADLNVRASSKGLMCGSGLKVHLKGGEVIEMNDGEASLIPQSEDIERFEVGETLAWVLVVEKEAVFQTLCKLRLAVHEALPGPGLIITGKGYPDVATRQLVKTLSDNLPQRIPILALVDGDPYGIDILSVYKHGSIHMQHENEHLAAARVQWLGLCASELATLGVGKDVLLPITKHDERKARTLLKRAGLPAQWSKELQYMLFSRRKAEIEVLGALRSSDGIIDVCVGTPGYHSPREEGHRGIPLLRYLVRKICAACTPPDRMSL